MIIIPMSWPSAGHSFINCMMDFISVKLIGCESGSQVIVPGIRAITEDSRGVEWTAPRSDPKEPQLDGSHFGATILSEANRIIVLL